MEMSPSKRFATEVHANAVVLARPHGARKKRGPHRKAVGFHSSYAGAGGLTWAWRWRRGNASGPLARAHHRAHSRSQPSIKGAMRALAATGVDHPVRRRCAHAEISYRFLTPGDLLSSAREPGFVEAWRMARPYSFSATMAPSLVGHA